MSQILAMDYGAKRTGIAVTDDMQIIASGLTTVATESLLDFLDSYLKKEKVELFLIGENDEETIKQVIYNLKTI